jgi:hypothetical protein
MPPTASRFSLRWSASSPRRMGGIIVVQLLSKSYCRNIGLMRPSFRCLNYRRARCMGFSDNRGPGSLVCHLERASQGPAYVIGPRVLNSIKRRDRERIAHAAYARPRNGGTSTLPWSFRCQRERSGAPIGRLKGARTISRPYPCSTLCSTTVWCAGER